MTFSEHTVQKSIANKFGTIFEYFTSRFTVLFIFHQGIQAFKFTLALIKLVSVFLKIPIEKILVKIKPIKLSLKFVTHILNGNPSMGFVNLDREFILDPLNLFVK